MFIDPAFFKETSLILCQQQKDCVSLERSLQKPTLTLDSFLKKHLPNFLSYEEIRIDCNLKFKDQELENWIDFILWLSFHNFPIDCNLLNITEDLPVPTKVMDIIETIFMIQNHSVTLKSEEVFQFLNQYDQENDILYLKAPHLENRSYGPYPNQCLDSLPHPFKTLELSLNHQNSFSDLKETQSSLWELPKEYDYHLGNLESSFKSLFLDSDKSLYKINIQPLTQHLRLIGTSENTLEAKDILDFKSKLKSLGLYVESYLQPSDYLNHLKSYCSQHQINLEYISIYPEPYSIEKNLFPVNQGTLFPKDLDSPLLKEYQSDEFPKKHLTFSVSELQSYMTCPAKYYFEYILKLKSSQTSSLKLGIEVHSLIENFSLKMKLKFKNQIKDIFNYLKDSLEKALTPEYYFDNDWIFWKEYLSASDIENDVMYEKSKRCFLSFLKNEVSYLETFTSSDEPYAFCEFNLEFSWENYTLKGRIDRADTKDHAYAITDYKSSYEPKSHFIDLQPHLYALALAAYTEKPTSSFRYLYLKDEKENTVSLDHDILQKIDPFLKSWSEGHFNPKPATSKECQQCSFISICDVPKNS